MAAFPLNRRRPHGWTLRKKTLFFISLTLVGLLVALYVVSRQVLLRSYSELEEKDTRQNLDRAVSALNDDLDSLGRASSDYSAWDQTYAFIHGGNPNFVRSEFPLETFLRLRLSLAVLLDNSGKTIFEQAADLNRGVLTPIPLGLKQSFSLDSLLTHHSKANSKIEGILLLPADALLVTSQPIITSRGGGPVAGTGLMARQLDAAGVDRVGKVSPLARSMR